MSSSLRPHGLQHARLLCPSPSPRACSNSCPFSQWCHPTISSSVVPFSSCLQSFPASGSFPMSQLSASGGQSTGLSASASVLPMNIQDWFPIGLTGLISLQYAYLLLNFSIFFFSKQTSNSLSFLIRHPLTFCGSMSLFPFPFWVLAVICYNILFLMRLWGLKYKIYIKILRSCTTAALLKTGVFDKLVEF